MIRDVELAEEALPKKAGGSQGSRRCLCLSLFSFLLVAGATTLFCLLHFGVIGPQREEVSALPAVAHSPPTERNGAGVRAESKKWGEGKRCAIERVRRENVGKDGEGRQKDMERGGGREKRVGR